MDKTTEYLIAGVILFPWSVVIMGVYLYYKKVNK